MLKALRKTFKKKNPARNKDDQFPLVKDMPIQHAETSDGKIMLFYF